MGPPPLYEGFTTRVAARVAGLSVPMLDYLCRSGTVLPSGGCPGRGRPRSYSFEDLIALRAVAHLLEGGVSSYRVRRALKKLQREGERPSSASYLVTDGKTILYCSPDTLLQDLPSGQFVFRFIVEMTKVTAQVAQHPEVKRRRRA